MKFETFLLDSRYGEEYLGFHSEKDITLYLFTLEEKDSLKFGIDIPFAKKVLDELKFDTDFVSAVIIYGNHIHWLVDFIKGLGFINNGYDNLVPLYDIFVYCYSMEYVKPIEGLSHERFAFIVGKESCVSEFIMRCTKKDIRTLKCDFEMDDEIQKFSANYDFARWFLKSISKSYSLISPE